MNTFLANVNLIVADAERSARFYSQKKPER